MGCCLSGWYEHALLPLPLWTEADALQLQELGLSGEAILTSHRSPAAQNRYIYWPNHLVRLPHPSFGLVENFSSVIREPLFKGSIWATLTEFAKRARSPDVQDESCGDFFSRRLSKPFVDRVLSAVIHGIYAGDVWKLSARSLFAGAWRDELLHGSVSAGALKNSRDGITITAREGDFLQEMKSFQWEEPWKFLLGRTSVFTLKDGLGSLTDNLARHLVRTGTVTFKSSTVVQGIAKDAEQGGVLVSTNGAPQPRRHGTVISTLAPGKLNAMNSQPASLVPDLPSVAVMTVNMYFRTPNLAPNGFGYLIPQATPFENNPERALGVVFDNAYSPSSVDADNANQISGQLDQANDPSLMADIGGFMWHNRPERLKTQDDVPLRGTKLTVMLGGHWWDGWPAYPDEQEGLALARSVLERHLGIKEEPEAWQVNLQKDCIPQYIVGHHARLKEGHNSLWREYRGRLRVAGSWMYGVGVNDCFRSAYEVVRALRDGRDGTGLEHVGAPETVRLQPKSGRESEEKQ